MMTTEELSVMLRIAVATLRQWRSEGKGPPWVKVNRAVRYRREDVERWLEERTHA